MEMKSLFPVSSYISVSNKNLSEVSNADKDFFIRVTETEAQIQLIRRVKYEKSIFCTCFCIHVAGNGIAATYGCLCQGPIQR
jgi:hypothetical protein